MPRSAWLLVVAALCFTPATSRAAPKTFDYYYFLGKINPQSWDGPYWWGLRTAVEELVVSRAVTKEIRSDRVGFAAFAVSFKVVNAGTRVAGVKALSLHAAVEPEPTPWRLRSEASEPQPVPWVVGAEARVRALLPGEAAELTSVIYLSERALRALGTGDELPPVELEISAQ